ncbi:thioesterase II family protein [Dactylosporangium sp. CA-139066]|uniref:thioesterase II family protein n=1 Tax=Dactylosporangium sp. CA-139066 TaxID=3239930 RepID=UPI003D8DB83D
MTQPPASTFAATRGVAAGDPAGRPAAAMEPAWFVPLADPTPAAAHVYAIPQAGGGCATFARLADELAPDIAVWALNLPGRQARFGEPPRTDLGPLLDELAASLAGQQRPILLGYCSGALLAMMLARRLCARGTAPAALIAVSYPAPHRAMPPRSLHDLDGPEFWQEILSYGGVPAQLAEQPDFREIFEVALRADYELLSGYEYDDEPPLDVAITMIHGEEDPVLRPADIEGWAQHTSAGFQSCSVSGDHWLIDGDLAGIAGAIRRAVAEEVDGR